ncbi:MAG: hypothetical protein ACLS7B_06980 [Hominilimicola sp.]
MFDVNGDADIAVIVNSTSRRIGISKPVVIMINKKGSALLF